MSDNKYTAMMGDEERWHTTRANVYRNVNKELADGCEKKAADWRAMREAWEAMVESLDEVMQFIPYEKPELGPLPNWICEIKARAEAALAKARAT